MTTIIKAANAAQFLSLVPHLVGFTPTQSLALVPFDGSRTLGVMRFDLPRSTDHEEIDRISSTCIGMVCRIPEADGIAAVVYTDAPFEAPGGRVTNDALFQSLLKRADACGLHVTDALCVASDAWGSYLDPECPPQGRPLGDIGGVDPGDVPAPFGDQTSGVDLPSSDLAATERTARALDALGRAVNALCGERAPGSRPDTPVHAELGAEASDIGRIDPSALDAACRLDDLPLLFELALGWDAGALAPYDAAALAWCLARPALRDVALSQWYSDLDAGDAALDAQLRWEAGEAYSDALARHMWGEGDRPDPARLAAALDLVRHTAALIPRATRPGALAACAWLSWALGRSTHADLYAAAAREIDPEHGLAEIVASFVAAGHLPDWAFHRPAPQSPERPKARRGKKR